MHRISPLRSDGRLACISYLLGALACACAPENKEVLSAQPLPDVPTPSFDGGGSPETASAALDAGLSGGLDARTLGVDATLRADADLTGPDAGDDVEICDGIDNDGDGIVDNRDVQHDGICDCLRIATLGRPRLTAGQENVFGGWLNARSDMGATALNDAVLTPQLLAPFEVIVTEDLSLIGRTYADTEVDALADWVRAGGGLLTLIGYAMPDERTNANLILARFGMSYGADPILMRSGAESVPVTTWLGPHPVIDGVTRIGVDNGYEVLGSGTTLAREGGYDLLKVEEAGSGHLIAFGDEWITYDSEWSNHPEYQVERLWVNMIKWLTPQRICQVPSPLL